MSTVTKCTKWTACSVSDTQAGSSSSDINNGGAGSNTSVPLLPSTEYIVKHTILLAGIDADEFNLDHNIEKSFVDAIVQILTTNPAAVHHVRAVTKLKDSKRRFLATGLVYCTVLYELRYDTKEQADVMAAHIEDSTGLLQTDSIFTAVFKSAMKRNNVKLSIISSILATKAYKSVSREEREKGDSTDSDNNGMPGDTTANVTDTTADGAGNGYYDDAGIIVGVVLLVFGIIGIIVLYVNLAKKNGTSFGTTLNEFTAYFSSKRAPTLPPLPPRNNVELINVTINQPNKHKSTNSKIKQYVENQKASAATAAKREQGDRINPAFEGETKKTNTKNLETVTDANGRRYSYNHTTKISTWIDKE